MATAGGKASNYSERNNQSAGRTGSKVPIKDSIVGSPKHNPTKGGKAINRALNS